MALGDFLPSSPSQGFSVLFNAGQFALKKLRGPTRVQLDTFEIDCTLSESISYEAEVTEFEVESGANISDHRRTKPVEIAIAGLVSDTPIDSDLIEEAVKLAAAPLGFAVDAINTTRALIAGDALITNRAFETLVQLYELGSSEPVDFAAPPLGVFSIVTKHKTYDSMVVKSLRFLRDRGTGRALPFFASFKEIRTVETSTAVLNGPAMLQAPNPLGEKGGVDASPALKAKASIAAQAAKAAGWIHDDAAYDAWLQRAASQGGK